MKKQCLQCNKTFHKLVNHSKQYWKTAKYCSVNCKNIGMKLTMKGRNITWGTAISIAKKGFYYAGDNVKKVGIHRRIEGILGKAQKCEHCNTITARKYEWANKKHDYKMILTDWMRLCTSCHRKYDIQYNNYQFKTLKI